MFSKNILITIILALMVSPLFAGEISDEKYKAFYSSVLEESNEDYEEAIEIMNKIYDKYAGDYLTNLRMGWLYYLKGEYNKSVEYYQKAVRISNNSVESLLGLTYPLALQNEWEQIERIYIGILAKDPWNYSANLRLGQIYLNRSEYAKAKPYLEKVYHNYPGDYEANLSMAWYYYYTESKMKSKELFINALIIDPESDVAKEGLELLK